MGHSHTEIIENVQYLLGKSESVKSSLYLFGSRAIHLERDGSDYDLLLITRHEIGTERKKIIKKKLSKINYNLFIFSEQAASSVRPACFIDSTAIEGASRYGLKLYGSYILKPSMSEMDFASCRFIQALSALVEWNEWIISKKKSVYSNPSFVTKEFTLISLLIWFLERKTQFSSLISLGHFIQYNLENEFSELRKDPLFLKIETSGLLWSWLDKALVNPLSEAELDDWAIIIGSRLKLQFGQLSNLKDQDFCHEFRESQMDDRIFAGLDWDLLRRGEYRLHGGVFGLLARLVLGLTRRPH